MSKNILFSAIIVAFLICGVVGAAPTLIGMDRLNWSQSLPSGDGIIFSGTAPGTTTNALYSDSGTLSWNGGAVGGDPCAVTIGDGSEYDIDIGDYSAGYQGKAIPDAINLLMTKYGNRGGIIRIAPITINDSLNTTAIWLNHPSGNGRPLMIIGSGVGGYTSTDQGTVVRTPLGIMCGNFSTGHSSQNKGIFIKDLSLRNNLTTPAGVGIDCNATAGQSFISLENLLIMGFATGVDLSDPGVYGGRFENVAVTYASACGFKIFGYANVLDDVITGYEAPYPTDGIYITGNYNHLVGDVGYSKLNVQGGSNQVYCWAEPSTPERNVSYIYGSSNRVSMFSAATAAPWGRIWVVGYGNYIDPCWDTYAPLGAMISAANITIEGGATSYCNTIKMYPMTQSASKGVITDNGYWTNYDYGHPMYSASPSAGYWYRGAAVWNTGAAGGGSPGWVCVATGASGTWKAMANLAS